MTLHVHRLDGCAPSPLAHYLKALAVLRLVAEQREPTVRGFWRSEAFCLVTSLTRAELLHFFATEYAPTPILNPWNAGSGFYFRESKSKEKDASGKRAKTGVRDEPTAATRAMEQLLASQSPRLAAYRACATAARAVLTHLGFAEAPSEDEKARLIATLRSKVPEAGLAWLDAAVASLGDEFACAPLVGSGGNDGNEDFSCNFLRRVLELTSSAGADARLVESALFSTASRGAHDGTAGQFFPGGNGGVNAGPGFDGKSVGNPWDYVLGLEGAVCFGGAATRKLDAATSGGAFPFAVRVDPAGYASAADADRDASRFEVWLPLWSHPATYAEVRALLAEGRARVSRAEPKRTTELARAVASLGTSRGLRGFARTAFLARNGKMHYSAPAGRWDAAPAPRVALLEDIERWLTRFTHLARDKQASKLLRSSSRALDEAVLSVCRSGADARAWQRLLLALTHAEAALLGSPAKAADPRRHLAPLPPLHPGWLEAVDDGSVELRLAIALASQDVCLRHKGGEVFANVRSHWLPLDRDRGSARAHVRRGPAQFAIDGSGLAHDPDVVGGGDALERDLSALVRRRMKVAPSLKARTLGMVAKVGAGVSLADIDAFLTDRVDDARVLDLSRALMAIAWWETSLRPGRRCISDGIDARYAVVHLAHALVENPVSGAAIPLEPEAVARLAAGDLAAGVAVCLRRLRSSGLQPTVRVVAGDARFAARLVASLAFPLRPEDTTRCLTLVTKPQSLEESAYAD